MSININSISDAHQAYVKGNITAEERAQIRQRWAANIDKWDAEIASAKDDNKYDISDDNFSAAKAEGKQNAKDETGFSGKKGGMIARGAADTIVGVAGNLGMTVFKDTINGWGASIAYKLGAAGASKGAETAGKAVLETGTENAGVLGKDAAGKTTGAFIITAPLALAVGVAYKAKKPNKDAHEAAQELKETLLPDANGELAEAQAQMDEATENVIELTDEANEKNEDANEQIMEDKTQFDQFRESMIELKEKAESGEKLTDSEKELYQELVPTLQELGENIGETQEETGDEVGEMREEIGEYQGEFDSAAESIAEVQGLTDFAAGFDETAQVMTYVEAAAQGLNAATGTQAALQAGKYALSHSVAGAWAWAFVGMGAGGAALSGFGAKEQLEWGKDIGQEINARQMTQDLGNQTLESYDEQIEMYDDNIELVEDLELEIPKDLEIPEEEVPGETENVKADSPQLAQTESSSKDDKDDKDKKKKV